MKKNIIRILLVILFSTALSSTSFAISYYTYTNGGSGGIWAVAGTWTTDPSGISLTGSAVPGNNDNVTVLNGFTVTLGANVATTGLTLNINNGGTLDLSTFTMATITSLSGSGTLRIKAGYFPTITTNNFPASYASGATVEFYDFTGSLPVSINYPNLIFSNSTSTNHIIAFANTSAYSFNVFGNLTTNNTSTGTLVVRLGTQITNILNLTIGGNFTIGVNTTFGIGAFNAVHVISIAGNMTNNGTVQLSNSAQYATSANGAANVTFTSATDKVLACNGVTNFYTLTVDKGSSSTNILSVTSTSTLNFNLYFSGVLITVTNGTLKLGSNIDIPRLRNGGNYDLGTSTTSPMFWIDGATVNTNGSAFVAYGKFKITSGSFTSLTGEGCVIREEGQYIIEGGTFTTEKFRPSNTSPDHRGSFIMSGGIFNAVGTGTNGGEYARFSIPYPEQVFIMSGGIINVSSPQSNAGAANGGIHIGCKAANYTVTGGTINAILSGAASFFDVLSTVPLYNFNITRTGGTPTTVRLASIGTVASTETTAKPLTILNDFTIDGTNNPVFNANGQNVTVGRNMIINTGGTYTPGANITTFNGTGVQLITNDGTITSGFYNLTINKPSGSVTLDGAAVTFNVTQILNLQSGILNDGGKTLQVSGNIYNAAIHTGTGNITLNGASTQTLSGDGNGIFGNLVLNNASTPGATLTSNVNISGVLTLAGTGNSLLDISQYTLALTSTSATAITTTGNTFSSAKMIRTLGLNSDGGVKKTFGSLSAFTFPFGVGSNYTPATTQLTSAPTMYGTITSRPVSSRHQFVVSGNTNNLTWHWKVVSAGFAGVGATAVTQTFQYVEASVSPSGDDVNYIPARYNPSAWTVISDLTKVDEVSNIISFTGVGYIDGEFTAGVPAAFGTVKVFYSKRNGNWTDVGAGTTPWSNVSYSGADATTFPVVGDHVYIGDGTTFNHIITVTTNAQASGGLEINAGSTLNVGVSTGHNFGTLENSQITGSGLLRISSSTATAEFPAGDFGNFIRTSGGTVEYYTTGTQDFTIPLNSSAPTNLPLITYRNLVLTPGTGRFIRMPDADERIYGNMIVQGSSSTGVARLNAATSRSLIINGDLSVTSGNLQFQNGTAQSIQVDGNIAVGSGAIIDMASSGSAATNTLIINGNLINNGIFDLANTASYISNTTFTGTANTSITGTGSTTDFNILTVSKGTSQTPILNVNATAFSLSGPTLPLVLNNGTFRLSSNQTVIFANGSDFTIPTTAKLSANGGTLQLTGGNGIDLLVSGTLEVLNGTIDVGTTANDNSIEYAATGLPTIIATGGSLNVMSQIRRSFASSQGALQYIQSGGIVSVGLTSATTITRGVFEILNAGSSFTMSGGTLRIIRGSGSSSISDLHLQAASNTVTGGTIEIGTAAISQIVDINSIVPVYNVTVTGTTNTARLEINGLTIRGSLVIDGENIFNASGLNISVAGNFTNLNTTNTIGVTVGGYRAGSASQTTTINGSLSNQSVTGALGNLTNFANLVINNTFTSGLVSLLANTNLRVNGTLTLTSGILAGAANTITAVSTVSNSSTHTNTTGGSITLAGSSSQLVTGNGSGKFGDLVLNNASGATFGANQEVTGTLTLTSGSLNIGSFGLNLSNTSLTAISGTTSARYIITSGNLSDAGVTKAFAASVTNGNFIYPIGVSGKYTPANYTISTGAVGGNITITPVNSKHPNATGSGTAFINYYWNVNASVIILNALTHTYTYAAADEAGIVTNYRDARFKAGAWTVGITAGNPNTTTRVITFTNTDLAGSYTAGEQTAFINPTTYTSIASGSWESDLTVWDIDPPGINLGPPAGSFVIISVGHTVTMTGNAKRTATIDVRGRLNLGTTTGHDFGTVSTSGAGVRTIQLQSSTFPAGDFTTFNAANGGTVEYDGTVILPTQNTYNNLSFTSAGTKTLPNADLTINGNLTVLAGTATNAVNNRNIVLTNTTGDFTNNGVFVTGTGAIIVGRNLINTGAGASFTASNGSNGIRIAGSLTNSTSATFLMGTDSLGVRGAFNNSATFIGNTGAIRISGNLNNTAGAFTGGAGVISVTNSLTNNATYTAGSGATSVGGSYLNSGASASYTANANALTITGNFTNGTSATFNANTGSVSIAGNWNNSATFNAGTGSVTFSSAGAQTLTGATTFNNIIRANGGSLTLNNNITAGGTLTFSNGKIITGTNVVSLTNTSAQPVSGQTTTSFIDGRLSISFPNTAGTSRIYPVGKGATYRPVTIQQGATSTSPVVRVEMIDTPPTGSFPSSVESLSDKRYYAINLLSGTMNSPTVQLSFNTNNPDEAITTPSNIHVLRSTASSGPWTDESGSGVYSPAAPAGYVISGITSLSSATLFTLGLQSTPLPISLIAFEASLKGGIVELKWSTASEKDNAYFTIERSRDAKKFDSLMYAQGAGNSYTIIHYINVDNKPLSGVSYYRLKQTDYDGKFTYSKIVIIENLNEETTPVKAALYPNPSNTNEPLYLKLTNTLYNTAYLQVIGVTGVTYFTGNIEISSASNGNDLQYLWDWKAGIYFIHISTGSFKEVKKLIIY